MAESIVHTPYNFIPFSKKILERYTAVSDLPSHAKMYPELKTGQITFTLTAETPVFIGDGNKNENGKSDPFFLRDACGRYIIPGSTVRGMVRENMQILSPSAIIPGEDFQDIQIFYRRIADANDSVGKELKDYYHNVLDVRSRKSASGKPYSIPENVKSGYLRKNGKDYEILPTTESYLRISRSHPDLIALQLDDKYAQNVNVAYTEANGTVKNLVLAAYAAPGMKTGTLLLTGKPVGKKTNHQYIFPSANREAAPVPIPECDALSYEIDWKQRENSLKAYYNINFWKLPESGDEKPVFYIQHGGHVYFGMSLFPRIGYSHALSDGLPNDRGTKKSLILDYPHSILGFSVITEDDSSRKLLSYRSRVSFSDCLAVGNPKPEPAKKVILGEPKPSYFPGYVINGNHYNEDGFQLRGYKQYWLKRTPVYPRVEKENVATTLRPLPAGTVFQGTIRFKNLAEDELGLLLWCLTLDKDCFQSIGMGKPLGLGRMTLCINTLTEFNPEHLYRIGDLTGALEPSRHEQIDAYIKAYESYVQNRLTLVESNDGKGKKKGKKKLYSLRNQASIQDFLFMRRYLDMSDASYMDLEEYRNIREPLITVEEVRKEQEEASNPKEKRPEDMTPLERAFYEAQMRKNRI